MLLTSCADYLFRGLRPLVLVVGAIGFLVGSQVVHAETPPGTIITNQALITARMPSGGGDPIIAFSNKDTFSVLPPPITIPPAGTFRLTNTGPYSTSVYPRSFQDSGGVFHSLSPPPSTQVTLQPDGSATVRFNLSPPISVRSGGYFLLRFEDRGANINPFALDTILVSVSSANGVDHEILRLVETAENSGIFTGLITAEPVQPAASDGRISMPATGIVSFDYVSSEGTVMHAEATIMVDPFGLLFDSVSGEPINDVAITMVNDATGLPASVFGYDGVSTFPSTVTTGSVVQDSSGGEYRLGRGRYVFPRVAPGRYRLIVQLSPTSGFTFPTTKTNAALTGVPAGPFAIAEGSRGEAYTVGETDVQLDLPADPNSNTLVVSLVATTQSVAAGDPVQYQLSLTNNRTLESFADVNVTISLPLGFRLEKHSVKIEGQPSLVSMADDGESFQLRVPSLAGGSKIQASFVLHLSTPAPGWAVAAAEAGVRAVRSNRATAAVFVRDDLMESKSHILGRIVRAEQGRPTQLGVPGITFYLETGEMVVSDARGNFHFEGLTPGTHIVQMDTGVLPAGEKPIVMGNLFSAGGDPASRLVDLSAGSAQQVTFAVERVDGIPAKASIPDEYPLAVQSVYDKKWIETQSISQEWAIPVDGEHPTMPATRILVKHHPGHSISALLNGEPVSALKFAGVVTNSARTMMVSLWEGVDLVEGDNVLEIVRTDSFGNVRQREKRVIHYASPPVRADLVIARSTLNADGVNPPIIAIRLSDRDGHPARRGVQGNFSVAEPYAPLRSEKFELPLMPGTNPEKPTYVVEQDGIAKIRIQPTLKSGTARVFLPMASGVQEVRVDLTSDRKEWIVIGLAEGSIGNAIVGRNLEPLSAESLDARGGFNGHIAIFAKGRIRGGWLLTAAYDSAKNREKRKPLGLHGLLDPDAYYTVFGDESQRQHNAPSRGPLYVKLERKEATVLIGDFSLDWTSTAFTTFGREMHGAKAEYRGKNVRISAFQSDAGLSAMRDEFRGDGTSGLYSLARRGVVPFSDRVVIQERDRNHPDQVLLETPLTRNIDYVMDYVRGTVQLSRPLFSLSSALQPLFLVVAYRLEDATAGKSTGGRGEVGGDKISLGATLINERNGGLNSTVSGIDLRTALSPKTSLRAEAALSNNSSGIAMAYRGELVHKSAKGELRAFIHEVQPNFGLGDLNLAQLGNRRYGVEATQKLTRKATLRGQMSEESALSTHEQRQSGNLLFNYELNPWTFETGIKAVRDDRLNGLKQETLLAVGGISRKFIGDRIEARFDREQIIAGSEANQDYPTRSQLSVSAVVNPKATIYLIQEWTEATNRNTSSTLAGVKSTPWKGGNATSGVTQSYTGGGTTLNTGLDQKIQITPRLAVNGGFQHAFVIVNPTAANKMGPSITPFHSKSGFSTAAQNTGFAAFVGAHWQTNKVSYRGRIELSEALSVRRSSLLTSVKAEPGKDLGLLGSVMAYQLQGGAMRRSNFADLRLGLAWRPTSSSEAILNRIDFIRASSSAVGGQGDATKFIDNFQWIHHFGSHTELSLHIGAKYNISYFDEQKYAAWTTLYALDLRRLLTPNWEIGMQTASLSDWRHSARRYSAGVFVGRRISRELTVTLGANLFGFKDDDFSAARQTRLGLYMRFRLRVDQNTLRGLLHMIQED